MVKRKIQKQHKQEIKAISKVSGLPLEQAASLYIIGQVISIAGLIHVLNEASKNGK